MANESKLKKLQTAVYYETVIPQTNQKVKFRAYNVREEKTLLLADASEDGTVMINALNNVIKSCLEPQPESLTSFDLEFLFAKVRSKSVGEIATVIVGCDTEGCEDVKIEYPYPLSDIAVVFPDIDKTVKLSEQIAVQMKYPQVEDSLDIEIEKNEVEKKYKAIKSSIDVIFVDGEAIKASEEPEESLIEFIDNLNPQEYRKLEHFFSEMPMTQGSLKYRCTKCKKEHQKTIKGLANFF